jgi:hypothetical protein
MSDEKDDKRTTSCKFVDANDADARNEILFKKPETIDEWQASMERCMQIVEGRMDAMSERSSRAARKASEAIAVNSIVIAVKPAGADDFRRLTCALFGLGQGQVLPISYQRACER